MAIGIQILGDSGTGKTYSLRNLDPKKVLYINCDRKSLPFRGWKKLYNRANKNYFETSNIKEIKQLLAHADKNKAIEVVVIDTINTIMSDKEMNNRNMSGFDKWMDYAGDIYDLYGSLGKLRDNLKILFIGHTEYYNDNHKTKRRLKTGGAKLTKLNIEGLLTYTLYTEVERKGNKNHYYFLTQSDGTTTARSPHDCFAGYKIDNDLAEVIKAIDKFENEV